MATLQIRKKFLFTWLHIDGSLGEFILSNFYFSQDNNKFQIIEQGESKRRIYNVTDITVYDDTAGGIPETFTTITALSLRLEALRYIGFNFQNTLNPVYVDDTASHYLGKYNASTNTPTLTNGIGFNSDFYEVEVGGNPDFGAGNILLGIGDWIYYDGFLDKWTYWFNSRPPIFGEWTLIRHASGNTGSVIQMDDLAHGQYDVDNYCLIGQYKNYTADGNIHNPLNYEPKLLTEI